MKTTEKTNAASQRPDAAPDALDLSRYEHGSLAPWHIRKDHAHEDPEALCVTDDEENVVSRIEVWRESGGRISKECEANANLIADAPRLLARLAHVEAELAKARAALEDASKAMGTTANFASLSVGDTVRLNPSAKWPHFCVDKVSRHASGEICWAWLRNVATGKEYSGSPESLAKRFPRAELHR